MKFDYARLRVHVFVLFITCATTALLAQNASTSASWSVVPSPNGAKCKQPYLLCLTPAEGNVLYAAAALSSTDMWAVGAEPHQSAVLTATVAEHRNGTGLSSQLRPSPSSKCSSTQFLQ